MLALGFSSDSLAQSPTGSIRGSVTDKDFDSPLPGAQVLVVETGQRAATNDQGNYTIAQVAPGKYTIVISKDGYARQVRADVLVNAGQLTDVDAQLVGEFTDLDEFLVQDILQIGTGTEASLLKLRFESAALLDSISADLMSRAGAGDAASALKLVSGTSVQDGKYAVVRGLPDRYVSSQMNGVRLPTSDLDKRAVQLDQFPAAAIESIQVSKTFTPDQQGDASGGAVNIRLKSIPNENMLQFKFQGGVNSQVYGANNFITYTPGKRNIQGQSLGQNWIGDVGVHEGDEPRGDYKWSLSGGGKLDLANGVKIGGFGSVFFERKTSFYDDGRDDQLWVDGSGQPLTPAYFQGTPSSGGFKTALYDITKSTISEQAGELATFGLEVDDQSFGVTYLATRSLTDTSTLAIDTRGKEYFFPGYNPYDPTGIGNTSTSIDQAPYLRIETLNFTDRRTMTLQFNGQHKLPFEGFEAGPLQFTRPELDWVVAKSWADLNQPDKRQFSALWTPTWLDGSTLHEGVWTLYKPAENFTIGNLQRIWKSLDEESKQYSVNFKLPFEQWSSQKGYFKFGLFQDRVVRRYNQDSFSNLNDNTGPSMPSDFSQPWSSFFPDEDHPVSDSPFTDVDYFADQVISARYGMVDLPLTSFMNFVGGLRFESTKMSIVNIPDPFVLWYPAGSSAGVSLDPGEADVAFDRIDFLPSFGLVIKPIEQVKLQASRSKTIARQTFKEMTPILQSEYLGGPIFIGNPDLDVATLKNWDVRLDYTPYSDGLFSISWFKKEVDSPIEYVQGLASGFNYTTAVNYPEGKLQGFEIEARQGLGHFWGGLEGLSLGANATFIDSEVTMTSDEISDLQFFGVTDTKRDMTNAPEHIYNLFATYDIPSTGTQVGLFYSVQGDTLIAGAGSAVGNSKFVPPIYAKEYGTLNATFSQKIGKYVTLSLQGKNLTNPNIETVYRSDLVGGDVTKSNYTKGIDYTLGLSVQVAF